MPYELLDAPQGRYEILPPAEVAQPVSRMEKIGRGMMDPISGGAQLLTHMLPDSVVSAGNNFNNWLADKTGLVGRLPEGGVDQQIKTDNASYEARRAAAGESGFDGYRALGNFASPANIAVMSRIPAAASLAGRMGLGAVAGASGSAMAPVVEGDDYAGAKGAQIVSGAMLGAAIPALVGGVSRIISPNASSNPNLALLKQEGVTPTIGQALGGRWNALEEKMMSTPILGDMISGARGRSLDQFNNAAINRASGQVGVQVDGTGQAAVRQAGDALSGAYDDALNQIRAVHFDPQFSNELTQLKGMAQQLTPPMRAKFNTKLDDVVGGRMSGTGAMLGDVYKRVDSEIGGLAAKYQKSAVASESELGDAFAQLQNLLKQQAMRSNPQAAEAMKAADTGWANLVRIEQAAKAGKNAEGAFTPAQLNAAIQQADKSVRGRAVSRGTALMQDLGNAGQQVLGNKVPNSFTTDRLLLGGGAIGSGLLNPAIPLGLLGAGAMYTKPMQGLLSSMVSARPQLAKPVADALRKASPSFGLLGAQVGSGLLN